MKLKKYFGKYRGTVLFNDDPLKRARIFAEVPAVSSLLPTTWCEPCLPLAGIKSGAYMVPAIGAGVWIEYEQGDVARPIWTGCFWGSFEDVPDLALIGLPGSPSIVLQTTFENTLMISDMPGPLGGILLKTKTAQLSINDTGITLRSGSASITMTGATITITNGTAIINLAGSAVSVNGLALIVD
jgi:uncharacterized protein involved in type VI secretion and phage assembly